MGALKVRFNFSKTIVWNISHSGKEYSAILPYMYSAILPYIYSAILPYMYSVILPYMYSAVLPYMYSLLDVQLLDADSVQQLHV
jgi:hypothetical protein